MKGERKMRKNTTRKIISLILAAALCVTGIDVSAATQNTDSIKTDTVTEKDTVQDKETGKKTDKEGKETPVVIREIKSERSKNSNTYLLNNGMKKTVYYSDNIRYEEDGKFKAYDPELVKTDGQDREEISRSEIISEKEARGYSYVNRAGDTKQYIPEKMGEDSPLLLAQDKYRISFVPVTGTEGEDGYTAAGTGSVKIGTEEVENAITGEKGDGKVRAVYEDTENDMKLSYQSMEHGIKEDIVLDSVPETNVFIYRITAENMTARLDGTGGGISFIDEDKDMVVAGIPAPCMNDSTGSAYSEDVYYELEKTESRKKNVNTYILKIVADSDYLRAPERKYPVTVDPSITWEGTGELGEAYVLKASGDTNYYSSGVKAFSVGKGSQGLFRTYMRALDLKSTVTGKYVESAKLTVYENGANTKGVKINIQPAAKEFKCSTLTWNNQPKSTGDVLASFTSSGTADAKRTVNMTTWARNIAKGSGSGNKNYGLMFKADDESVSSYVKFYGARTAATAKMPKLEVVYYDGPTKPDSVSLAKVHMKSGEKLQVSWTGITSKALDYVQYKVKNYDESSQAVTTDYIDYSDSTKIGTTSSGTKTIDASNGWKEGHYILYVRGVDKGGIKSDPKGVGFVIDRTAPVISSASVSPSTSVSAYSKQLPTVTWNVNEKYLMSVQAKVNSGSYSTIGTANAGSTEITGLISGQANTVTIRAVDKAGNISSEKTFTYYYDSTKPVVNDFKISPATSEEIYSDNEEPEITFNVSDSTLKNVKISVKNDEGDQKTVYDGSSAQGTVTVNKGILKSGLNAIFLSATDKAGNYAVTNVSYYHLDTDIPKTGTVTVTPKTSLFSYRSALPVIRWEGFGDDCLKEMQVSINDGAYRTLGISGEGEAQLEASDFTEKGIYELKIRAIDKAGHTSEEISKTYYYKDTVSEADKYKPINVSAKEKIGGTTVIRFDNEAGEYPEDIAFEIYRGTTPLFVPDDTTLVKSGVSHKGAMVSGEKGVTYYYKVRAVTVDGEKKYSDFSDEISSTTLTDSEISNRCGIKGIYEYAGFSTPNGNGSIELSKGNLVYEQSDIMLPAPQLPIEISRTYNSGSLEVTDFGKGWSCIYDAAISETAGKIYYRSGTGAVYEFTDKDNDGEYDCEDNSELKITPKKETIERIITEGEGDDKKEEPLVFDSSYVLTDKENDKYYFDECGAMILIEEANGTFLYMERAGSTGQIQAVVTSSNNRAEFSYGEADTDGKRYINKISISDGSYFEYIYENGIMTKAVHVGNKGGKIEYKYGYDSEGKLDTITDAMENEYHMDYSESKAVKVTFPDNEYISLNITDDKTTVSKYTADGNKLYDESYVFDTQGKKTRYVDAMGNESKYDYRGELLKSTENAVSYYKIIDGIVTPVSVTTSDSTEYDDNGNVTKQTDSEGNVTTYKYENTKESLKNLPTEIKVDGADEKEISRKVYVYDDKGNVVKVVDYKTNTVCTYKYDEYGNVTESQEALVEKEDINSISLDVVQDNSELENSMLVASKTETYDEDGNELTEVSSTDTEYESIETDYNDLGSEKGSIDEKEISLEYIRDEFGRTIKTIETSGNERKTTESVFDKNGKIKSSKDEVGRVTTYEYDEMGRVVKTTLIVGEDIKTTTTEYSYDDVIIHCGGVDQTVKNARVITVRNTSGEITGKTYTNNIGQIVRELSGGVYVDYTYDKQGQVFTTYTGGGSEDSVQSNTEGKLSVSVYDENGNLTDTIINPDYSNGCYRVGADSIVTSNVYNRNGMLVKTVNAKGYATTYDYDEQGRLIKVNLNNESFNLYEYDDENFNDDGELKSVSTITTDALGRKSRVESNGEGKTLSITDESNTGNRVTSYEYDTSGNMSKVKYTDGCYKEYTYDEYDILQKSVSYNNKNQAIRSTLYTYDKEDRLICKKDSKIIEGVETPYRYTCYTYDKFGRQTGISEINSDSEPSQEQKEKYMIKYTYNVDDDVTKIEYPDTTSDELKGVTFKYNKDKWIMEIDGILSGNSSTKIRAYEYYNNGKIKNIKDFYGFLKGGDGYIQRDYMYDVYDRVLSMKYYNSCNPDVILEQYEYAYDKNSNIISSHTKLMYDENKRDETKLYEYDGLDRLVKTEIRNNLTYEEKTFAYEYDSVGNRIKETEKESNIVSATANVSENTSGTNTEDVATVQEKIISMVYTYNDLNQLIRLVESDAGKSYITSYEYDQKGNRIKITDEKNNTITENVYNVEGQLTAIAITKDGKTATVQENQYNGDGQRISKTVNGIKTCYFYEGSTLLYTTDGEGNKTSQNVIGLEGNTIASIRYDGGQKAYFYSNDIQGSTSVITDDEGKYVTSYEYSDFGETEKQGDTGFYNEICYTGGVYDEDTGLYYLNARYYNPDDGVFFSQDTYRGEDTEPATWNLYGYCAGNPIKYVDPSGHGRVIVSGGVYSKDKQDDGKFYYEFIEPALKEIYEHQSQKINWYIADSGWTKGDKNEMKN